jgi:hypothetical protein
MEINMNLLENSQDFIINSLELFGLADEHGTHRVEKANIENKTKWKLAFISLVQGFEILLKYGLEKINPILIYDDIDSLQLTVDKTVTVSKAMVRLSNFEKNPYTHEEREFIKKCFRIRNNFIHCIVTIRTEELKNKFAELYVLYCKGYKYFSETQLLFQNLKLEQYHKELHTFSKDMIIFRGEEVFRSHLSDIKSEIEKWANYPYFTTSTNEKVKRIAFGEENSYLDNKISTYSSVYSFEYCDDCCVKQGEYHLPLCDLEVCPICRGQRLSCSCDLNLPE